MMKESRVRSVSGTGGKEEGNRDTPISSIRLGAEPFNRDTRKYVNKDVSYPEEEFARTFKKDKDLTGDSDMLQFKKRREEGNQTDQIVSSFVLSGSQIFKRFSVGSKFANVSLVGADCFALCLVV